MLWKNKILFRAEPPFSSLRCLHLTLLHPPSPPLKLHSLCWKLSRKWHLACFFDSLDMYIAYQKSQSDSTVHVVKELRECLPIGDVVADEELMSGSLIVKAVDCSLRTALLENGWRCVGNGCVVNSSFASSEEKNDLYAIHLVVQADTNDSFVFLVSPDVVRFNRLKIMNLLGSKARQRFHGGEGVFLDECCFTTLCSVLPSLCEGHVKGISRLLPAEEDFEFMRDVWSFKHGLVLPNDYFVQIQFIDEVRETNQWFPSTFIIQGPGLIPAPQTIRASKVVSALESFMKTIEGWDFFDGGYLKIKGACWLGIGSDLPVWRKATHWTDNDILTVNEDTGIPTTEDGKISFFKSLLHSQDFRAPKPSPGFVSGIESSEHIFTPTNTGSTRKGIQNAANVQVQDAVSINMVAKFRPLFKGHTHSKKIILPGSITNKFCLLSDNGAQKTDLHKDKLMPRPALKGNATTEKHGLLKEFEIDLNAKEGGAVAKDGESLHTSSKTSIDKKNLQVFLDRVPLDKLSKSRKANAAAVKEFSDTLPNNKDKKNTDKQLKKIVGIAATKEIGKSIWKKQKMQHPEPPNSSTAEGVEQAILNKQAKQPSVISARSEDRDEKLQTKQKNQQQINSSDFVPKEIEKSTWKKQKMQHTEPPNNTTAEGVERAVLKKQAMQPSVISARSEDRDEKLQKKQTKQQMNPSDIVEKVMDCHARGQLGSLTVPELKCFLAARKAKVGGKKEDLIQRIVSMLA